jgi:N-acetylglucosamine malate deacetylase 2
MTQVGRQSGETERSSIYQMGSQPTPSGVNTGEVPAMVGPRSRLTTTVEQLTELMNQPVSTAFTAAAHWIKQQKDARFGVHTDVAKTILDRITTETGGMQAMPRVLVIVAHPDDEAIGAGAVLRGLPDVTVVHVTDGAPNDDEYARRRGYGSRDDYARARRDEVVTALEIIGIPATRIRGLDIVDGEAAWHLVELCNRVADLIEELKPDVVLTHPYEGGHSDHDSTAFAVHLGAGVARREGANAPLIMEMTSYHNYQGQRRLFNFLPFRDSVTKTVELSDEAKQVKRRMFEAFTSQQGLLRTIPVEVERFRSAPRYLFTVPPHEGQLDYERLCRKLTGEQWRAEAEKALLALRSRRQFQVSA